MFEGLSSGLESKKFVTPIASTMINASAPPPGMIAEPAQVVVLMPGSRAEKAESALGKIKMYIAIVSTLVVVAMLFLFYFWLRGSSKPQYAGKTLPGITLKDTAPSNQLIQQQALPQASQQTPQQPAPVQKKVISFEDIVSITGPIPIWEAGEEDIVNEKRISENDDSIANIIKAREALTKDIESFMSSGIKTA